MDLGSKCRKFRLTYAQNQCKWPLMLRVLLNQWSIGNTGFPETKTVGNGGKQPETVKNNRKQSEAVRHDMPKSYNPSFLQHKSFPRESFFLEGPMGNGQKQLGQQVSDIRTVLAVLNRLYM